MSSFSRDASRPRAYQAIESLIIGLLISVGAVLRLHGSSVIDPDIWWHLRTGQWIVAHHAIPRVDYYTNFAAGKPWSPYSWLFEVIAYACFRRFGLAAILVGTAIMLAAISAAIYHMVRRLQADFLTGVVITLIAAMSLLRLSTPRPWLFSILFSAVELDILFHARRTGRRRELLWLPLLYALWANIHIEFIDGIFLFGAAFVESLLAIRWSFARTRLRPAPVIAISLVCLLATLANPFGWRIYQIAYDMVRHSGGDYVMGNLSMGFRSPSDYLALLLALSAAATLGYARRIQVFEILLLAFGAVVSFRSQRDVWVLVLCAAAILAEGIPARETLRRRLSPFTLPAIATVSACVLFIAVRAFGITNSQLQKNLTHLMPVRAVEVIKANNYRGPLFNTYGWGGYLIWSLRMPVSIDGRSNVDGDQRIADSIHTWEGHPEWRANPALAHAGLVIGPSKSALAQLLRLDPRFQLAYHDKVADVFIARRLHEKPAETQTLTRADFITRSTSGQ